MSRHRATRQRYYQANKEKWRDRYNSDRAKIAARRKERYATNPNSPELRWAELLRLKYGLTVEQYNTMYVAQGYGCAICGGQEKIVDTRTGNIRRLAVDHDHVTGSVRGLLCSHCNRAIGLLGDNVDQLVKAIEYLRSWK